MPSYVFTGPGQILHLGHVHLRRGQPQELSGADAERAARHPRVSGPGGKGKAPAAIPVDALAARRELVARAKELGIPATGKNADLKAAIAAAEGAER